MTTTTTTTTLMRRMRMKMNNKPSPWLLSCLLLGLVLALALSSSPGCSATQTAASITKMITPEKTGKELRVSFKLFLTKMKLRRVPLAKARSEKTLSKLYHEERLVKEQIAGLEQNLLAISDKSRHNGIKVIEMQRSSEAVKAAGGVGTRRNLMKVSDLTQGRIDAWKSELAERKAEFKEIRGRIEEAKSIIKNPTSYISIPINYGSASPKEVQEREREVLVKDRLNMNYRASVESGEEAPPLWLTDRW